MPRILPRRYYEHAAVGRVALAALQISRTQIAAGLTRTSFLAAQLDTATTLEVVTLAAAKNLTRPGKKWRRTFTRVPSFCWVKLIADKWVVPAVCMLGAYPATSDVAKLASRFQTLEGGSLSIYKSHRRKGEDILHITGTSKPACHQPKDRLRDLGGVVGSQYPPPICALPSAEARPQTPQVHPPGLAESQSG